MLFAAYVKGNLLDQVAAESEDTAFSKLKMEYPGLKGDEVTFDVIDANFQIAAATTTEETEVVEATPVVVKKEEASSSGEPKKKHITVIEAAKVEITVMAHPDMTTEDLQNLAAMISQLESKDGMALVKNKGAEDG